MKYFSLALTLCFLIVTAHRSPAPIVEESTPVPTATPENKPKSPPPPPQSTKPEVTLSDLVNGESGEQKQKKSKKSKTKPERTPTTVTAPKSAPAPSAAPATSSHGFAGTWKGTLTDGTDWIVVVNPTETAATVRCSLGTTGGAAHMEGGSLWWSCRLAGRSSLAKQNVPWSMRLLGGGRAEVIAHLASGNNFGTMEKIN